MKEQPKLLEVGKAEVIQNFSNNGKRKVALFGLGNLNSMARKAAAQLANEGFDCAVINPRFTKPLDAGTHEFFGKAADVAVTLEDHALMGGYGSAVLELFSEMGVTTPVVRIGWPDQFIEQEGLCLLGGQLAVRFAAGVGVAVRTGEVALIGWSKSQIIRPKCPGSAFDRPSGTSIVVRGVH